MKKYDLVRIKKVLPEYKSHFEKDEDAIIEECSINKYGCKGFEKDFSLFIKGHGSVSWYQEDDLIFKESGKCCLLRSWEEELENDEKE